MGVTTPRNAGKLLLASKIMRARECRRRRGKPETCQEHSCNGATCRVTSRDLLVSSPESVLAAAVPCQNTFASEAGVVVTQQMMVSVFPNAGPARLSSCYAARECALPTAPAAAICRQPEPRQGDPRGPASSTGALLCAYPGRSLRSRWLWAGTGVRRSGKAGWFQRGGEHSGDSRVSRAKTPSRSWENAIPRRRRDETRIRRGWK